MFRILDYADQLEFVKETNTQLTCRCPVCFSKLQISKRNSAYFCVSDCDPVDIRRNMDLPTTNRYQPKIYVPPKSIPLPRKIDLHTCDIVYNLETQSFFHPRLQKQAHKTIYQYGEIYRIVRLDIEDDDEKMFYPNKLVDGKWGVEACDKHPFFNENAITQKNKFVTLVEGEKCAVALSEQGILAITPPPFGWSEDRLKVAFDRIYYDIEGVLVIPDNDAVGLTKAVRVQNACWRSGLPCRILNLEDYYRVEKEDIADLIQRGIDIKKLFGEIL